MDDMNKDGDTMTETHDKRTETHAYDLISRAAAINAICEDGTQLERQGQYTMTMAERKQRDADILGELPSAQPEIIRCRNCKFASGDSRICMKFGHSPIGELDFCAWAERRTDERTD